MVAALEGAQLPGGPTVMAVISPSTKSKNERASQTIPTTQTPSPVFRQRAKATKGAVIPKKTSAEAGKNQGAATPPAPVRAACAKL